MEKEIVLKKAIIGGFDRNEVINCIAQLQAQALDARGESEEIEKLRRTVEYPTHPSFTISFGQNSKNPKPFPFTPFTYYPILPTLILIPKIQLFPHFMHLFAK